MFEAALARDRAAGDSESGAPLIQEVMELWPISTG